MHLLITIQLISNSPADQRNCSSCKLRLIRKGQQLEIVFAPEKASAILAHGLDDVPLPPHHPLKPQVLLSPLGFRQGLAHVAVLILTIVPLMLMVNLYLIRDICLLSIYLFSLQECLLLLALPPGRTCHPAAGGGGGWHQARPPPPPC